MPAITVNDFPYQLHFVEELLASAVDSTLRILFLRGPKSDMAINGKEEKSGVT